MTVTFDKYVLKKPVMTDNRLQKIIKEILGDYREDRDKAIKGYELFLDKINSNTMVNGGLDIIKGMIECLKLAQSASYNQLKVIEICAKMNAMIKDRESRGLKDLNKSKTPASSLFEALDSVIGKDDDQDD